jgi:hypothetical protein
MYLNGIVSVPKIEAGQKYTATIGGLRNPRAEISQLKFTVKTYDADAFNDN